MPTAAAVSPGTRVKTNCCLVAIIPLYFEIRKRWIWIRVTIIRTLAGRVTEGHFEIKNGQKRVDSYRKFENANHILLKTIVSSGLK